MVQSLAALLQPYLLRDHTIFINEPYALPVAPAEEYGSIGSLLPTLQRYHENLAAQLNGTEDTFYQRTGPDPFPPVEQMSDLIDYLVQISPSLDPNITKKICVGYSAYCRKRGISHFTTGDPAEYAVAFVLFGIVFIIVLFCVLKPHRRSVSRKRQHPSGNRRC